MKMLSVNKTSFSFPLEMAERQQLRQQFIGLIRVGYSASRASRELQVPLATAKRWAKLFRDHGQVANRQIPGRPRISTRREDNILVRAAEENPFRSTRQLIIVSNFPGSQHTVRRRLREHAGLRSRRAAAKERLSVDHVVDRLAYASSRLHFDWRNVVFSDEVVVSSSSDAPARVYRVDGHRYDARYVRRLNRSGRVAVSCWGWMSYDGAGVLELIHDRLNSQQYLHILENVMIPSARLSFPEGRISFQQDNHPVHTAKVVQEWLASSPDVDLVEWPAFSPDFNPIEHVWARLKGILRSNWEQQPPIRTADELWEKVLNAWEHIALDVDFFHNLVNSMPRRMRAAVRARGWWTRY